MQSVSDQIFSFLLVMLLGGLMGIIFDLYVSIRRCWRPRQVGTLVGDFLFALIATIFAYAFLLVCNWGEVRMYVFLALVIGLSLYMKILSQYVRRLLALLFFALGRVIRRN